MHLSDIGDFRSSLVVNATVSNKRLRFFIKENTLTIFLLKHKTPPFHRKSEGMPLPVRLRVTFHILFHLDV